jgi:ssDNA-binding Zn-finger/Zn-ribbon topoisomerase 1
MIVGEKTKLKELWKYDIAKIETNVGILKCYNCGKNIIVGFKPRKRHFILCGLCLESCGYLTKQTILSEII